MLEKKAGWTLDHGEIKLCNEEDFLPLISSSLFCGKHTTTYKYCFLKSLLENLYSVDDKYAISFNKIGETFSGVFWNMINVYGIPQMTSYCTGARSVYERIIFELVNKKPYLKGVHFDSINTADRNTYLKSVYPEFVKNVIGAFYDDTNGSIFGFSKKDKKLWFSNKSYEFLIRNRFIIEQVNYYEWLKMIESILKANNKTIPNLSTVLEDITKRNDLTSYKTELIKLGEEKVCFYCGRKLNNEYHLDHFIPWDYLKTDQLWNFVFSCPTCNASKNNKLASDEYISKIINRNTRLSIKFPDIKKIYESAEKNGFKKGWLPSKEK